MDTIWAPWRMKYILGEKTDGCFICDIVASDEDRKNQMVKRGKFCVVLINRYPYNNGHLLVAPFRHVPSLNEMTPEERSEMMELTVEATNIISATMNADGFNIGLNIGAVAGAGLKDHVHQHIVPRWNGDTNFMPVIGDTKVIPQALDAVWELLHKEMND